MNVNLRPGRASIGEELLFIASKAMRTDCRADCRAGGTSTISLGRLGRHTGNGIELSTPKMQSLRCFLDVVIQLAIA